MSAAANPTLSQPFASVFPHIILLNDNYLELTCPYCDGNARSDSPNDFYKKLAPFLQHINNVHTGNITIDGFVNHQHRRLSPDEVQSIQAGDGRDVVQKKPVVKADDGTYHKLACSFCNGNARSIRGTLGAVNPKLIFFDSVDGLLGHIGQSHKDVQGGTQWVLENCTTVVTSQEFARLKADMTGELIGKVMGTMKNHKGWQGRRRMKKEASTDIEAASPRKRKTPTERGLRVQVLNKSIKAAAAQSTSAPSPARQEPAMAQQALPELVANSVVEERGALSLSLQDSSRILRESGVLTRY